MLPLRLFSAILSSLRARLILLFVLVAIPVAALVIKSSFDQRQHAISVSQDSNTSIADINAAADHQLGRDLAGIGVIAGLSFILVWLLGDIMIVQPAQRITRASEQLQSGDLSARTGLRYGTSELSELARTFDDMATALQRQQAERDNALHKLGDSEERYRLLVRDASVIEWLFYPNGEPQVPRPDQPRPPWEIYTGQVWPDYRGAGWLTPLHPQDRMPIRKAWAEAVLSKSPFLATYRLWHAPTGEYRHVLSRMLPRFDARGALIEWTGTVTDIHDRTRAQESQHLLLQVSTALVNSTKQNLLTGLMDVLLPALADWGAVALFDSPLQKTATQSAQDRLASRAKGILRLNHVAPKSLAGDQLVPDLTSTNANLSVAIDLDDPSLQPACLHTGKPEVLRLGPDAPSQTNLGALVTLTSLVQALTPVTPQLKQGHTRESQDPKRALSDAHPPPGPVGEALIAPLMVRGELIGVMVLGLNGQTRHFGQHALTLASEIAPRTALALDNQRLFEREVHIRRRAERTADYLLRQQALTAALADALTPLEVCEAILDACLHAFEATRGNLGLLNDARDALDLMCGRGYSPQMLATLTHVPLSTSVASADVARSGRPVWADSQNACLTLYPGMQEMIVRPNIQACAVVPLLRDDTSSGVLGVLMLEFDIPRPFRDEDRMLLTTFAAQATQALSRAQLFRQEKEFRRRAEASAHFLERLQPLADALATANTVAEVAYVVTHEVAARLGTRAALLLTPNSRGTALMISPPIGASRLEGPAPSTVFGDTSVSASAPVALAFRSGEPVWLDETQDNLEDGQPRAAIPVLLNGEPLGVLAVAFDQPNALGDDERKLLTTFAPLCATALSRAELFAQEAEARERAERNTAELRCLQQLTSSLASALTVEDVVQTVTNGVTRQLGAITASIGLLSSEGTALDIYQATSGSARQSSTLLSRLYAEVAHTGQPEWIEDHAAYIAAYPYAARLDQHAMAGDRQALTQALAALPLTVGDRAGDRVVGVLTVHFTAPHRFHADEKRLCMAFASQAAQALERAHLHTSEAIARSQAERNADYLESLQNLTAALSSAIGRTDVLRAFLVETASATGATAAHVSLVTDDRRALDVIEAFGWPVDVLSQSRFMPLSARTPTTDAVRTGQAIWIESAAEYVVFYPQHAGDFLRTDQQAVAAVPIQVDEHIFGALTLGFDVAGPFALAEKDLLLTASAQCALALERAWLYDTELQSRERAERNAAYLGRLQKLTDVLSAPLTRTQIAHSIVDAARSVLGAAAGAVGLVSDDDASVDLVGTMGYSDELIRPLMHTSIDADNLPNTAIKRGEPIWLEALDAAAAQFPDTTGQFAKAGYGASVFVPMKVGVRVIGLIGFDFATPRRFSDEEKTLLLSYAAQCAQAMERARYYEDSLHMNVVLEERVQARTAELHQANARLAESHEQLRNLSGQILAAVEDERTRIAREVHDELGQALTIVRIEMGRAKQALTLPSPHLPDRDGNGSSYGNSPGNYAAAERIGAVIGQVDMTLRALRRIAAELRPVILDDLGLEAAIDWQLEQFQTFAGIVVHLEKSHVSADAHTNARLDTQIEICAFRILQEALTNVAKHASATEVHITLRTNSRRLFLRVRDNGVGFTYGAGLWAASEAKGAGVHDRLSSAIAGRGQRGYGLLGMSERAVRIGGTLRVQTKPDGGTSVALVIPLNTRDPDSHGVYNWHGSGEAAAITGMHAVRGTNAHNLISRQHEQHI